MEQKGWRRGDGAERMKQRGWSRRNEAEGLEQRGWGRGEGARGVGAEGMPTAAFSPLPASPLLSGLWKGGRTDGKTPLQVAEKPAPGVAMGQGDLGQGAAPVSCLHPGAWSPQTALRSRQQRGESSKGLQHAASSPTGYFSGGELGEKNKIK